MAAAVNEDVRGHLRTRSVCATLNVEEAGETEMKKDVSVHVSRKRVASMSFNEEPLTQTHTFSESLPLPYVTRGF